MKVRIEVDFAEAAPVFEVSVIRPVGISGVPELVVYGRDTRLARAFDLAIADAVARDMKGTSRVLERFRTALPHPDCRTESPS